MTARAVLVNLPENVYARMREEAEQSDASVEDMLSDMAALFFAPASKLESVLDTMESYTGQRLSPKGDSLQLG